MNKKITYIVAGFLVSGIVGFGVTRFARLALQDSHSESVSMGGESGINNIDLPKTSDTLLADTIQTNSVADAHPLEVIEEEVVEVKKPEMERKSAKWFETLLVNESDNTLLGGNTYVAKNIKFSFIGLKEGENRPYDVLGIREKLYTTQVWKKVSVSKVGYDEVTGKIVSAVIVISQSEPDNDDSNM